MHPNLESLDLTGEELEVAKATIRRMAYFNWLDTGKPDSKDLDFWLKAEQHWIGRNYVPHRLLNVAQPSAECPPQQDSIGAVNLVPCKTSRPHRVRRKRQIDIN